MSQELARADIVNAALPATYEQAKQALATCQRIDECKDWADKMAALASYAKQAEDQTLLTLATQIAARAISRAGELLRDYHSPGGRPPETRAGAGHSFSQKEAGANAGMSERQIKTAIRVANVPREEFERLVESEHPPTITELARLGTASRTDNGTQPGFKRATQALYAIGQFATFCEMNDAVVLADAVYSFEVNPLRKQIAAVEGWLAVFNQHLNPEAPQ